MRVQSQLPVRAPSPSLVDRLAADVGAVVGQARGAIDQFVGAAAKAPVALAPTPLPSGGPELSYDGELVGAGGASYAPGTPVDDIPGFMPADGSTPTGTIVFVNGAFADHAGVSGMAQSVANASGDRVVAIDNATQGWFQDLFQAVEDLFHVGQNKATQTLTPMIVDHLERGEPLHLLGHSQGAIIIADALRDARDELLAKGWTQAQLQSRMHELLEVETMAGGAHWFIDGPKYVHYVNHEDIVPMTAGVGGLLPGASPGAGAKIIGFDHWVWSTDLGNEHDLSVYLQHRLPFDQAYGSSLAVTASAPLAEPG